jgi:ferrochelatase
MAYGGPTSLDEMPGYLADIRSGRTTPPDVVAEIMGNYARIGGKSPLPACTQRQADAVTALLNEAATTPKSPDAAPRFVSYVGMRHWAPWIDEQVGRMIDDGITRAVSVVLAPHYSAMSIAKYQGKIADGLAMYGDTFGGTIEFAHIDSYHDAPGLIAALAARVQEGLQRWPAEQRDTVHVVFSAHSLPERILQMGDPYAAQLRETARLVAERAGLAPTQWSWSYQSAGRSPEPWLGPQLREHLASLADRGIRDVISVPVGFVSDHVEILYDIDIDARRVADGLGVRLERPPALNDDPVFVRQLADLVRDRARRAGWLTQ